MSRLRADEVETILDGRMYPGLYFEQWGKNNLGKPVVSGVYFCRLDVCGQTTVGKTVPLKWAATGKEPREPSASRLHTPWALAGPAPHRASTIFPTDSVTVPRTR